MYLHRESQFRLRVSAPFDGSYGDGGLHEDMHGLYQDQGERLVIVQTFMETLYIYRPSALERSVNSIKKLPNHPNQQLLHTWI